MYHKDNKPYTDADLRRDLASGENAVTILPKVLTDEIRAAHGMYPVEYLPKPEPLPAKRIVQAKEIIDGSIGWEYEDIPLEERMSEAQRECKRRILAVASTTKQLNMAAAVAAGLLDDTGKGLYTQGLLWIASMRQTWHNLAEQGADVYSDSNWPECPAEVVEFAKAF
jgi:hypothetical protein